MPSVNFFQEDTTFKIKNKALLRNWIEQVVALEGQSIDQVNFVYCSDSYLLQLNRTYLKHNFYTDIITFDNNSVDSKSHSIDADIFISIDRVRENAKNLHEVFYTELHRVMIHGILHLLGQSDKTKADKMQMRKREEACLSLLKI